MKAYFWTVLLVNFVMGCSSGDSGGACGASNPQIHPACNECLRGACCAEMSACVQGTECNACARGSAACSSEGEDGVVALGNCTIANCAEACGIANGGAGGTGGGGASGTSGGTAGTAPIGGTQNMPEGGAGGMGCAAPCGDDCCNANAFCFEDGGGNTACAIECEANSECPTASPVCTLFDDGISGCTEDLGAPQRCASSIDCETGACAPNTDTAGDPVGPYICVPDDGGAYHGCSGLLTSCGGGYCCFTDAEQNQFCARPCETSAECGDASCVVYDNSNTTCAETMGCGL